MSDAILINARNGRPPRFVLTGEPVGDMRCCRCGRSGEPGYVDWGDGLLCEECDAPDARVRDLIRKLGTEP